MKPYPESVRIRVLQAYKNGVPVKEISRNEHVGKTSIHRWVTQYGAPKRRAWRRNIEIDEHSLIAEYLAGEQRKVIATNYGVSETYLSKLLKKNGVPTRQKYSKPVSLKVSQVNEIREYIAGGVKYSEIAKKFGLTDGQLRRVREENSIPSLYPNSFKRRHNVPDILFTQINGESAYWVGILCADGSLQEPGSISYKISAKDLELMNQYVTFLGLDLAHCYTSEQVLSGKSFPQIEMRFHNTKVFKTLVSLGLNPGTKSVDLDISDSYLINSKFFWRGMLDGDGWVGKDGYPAVGLVGTKMMCEKFIQFLQDNYGLKSFKVRKVNRTVSGMLHSIQITGQSAVRVVIGIWSGGEPALKRKSKRAQQIANKAGYSLDTPSEAVEIPRESVPQGIHIRPNYPSPYSLNLRLGGKVTRLGSYKTLGKAISARHYAMKLISTGYSKLDIVSQFGKTRTLPPGVKMEENCEGAKYSCTLQVGGRRLYFGCFLYSKDAGEIYETGKSLALQGDPPDKIKRLCTQAAAKMKGFRLLKHHPQG